MAPSGIPSAGAASGATGASVELVGRHVILASGSVPRTIPGFAIDGRLVITAAQIDQVVAAFDQAIQAVVG